MNRARILLAKVGLDSHDQGIHLLARKFRDTGFEVIMTGRFWSPAAIAQAAVEEDVDLAGLSILSGAHIGLTADVIEELNSRNASCDVIVGGTILDRDVKTLLDLGCRAVFPVGSQAEEIVLWVREHLGMDE